MYVLKGEHLAWGGMEWNGVGGAPIATGGGRGVDGGVWVLLHLNERQDGHGRMAYPARVRMAVYGRCGCYSAA